MFFFSFLWVGVGVLAPSFVMTRFLDKHPPLGCSSLHWCNTHQLLNLVLTRACFCIEGSQGRHLLNSTSEFSIHRKQSGQRTWMLYTNLQIFHIPFLFFSTPRPPPVYNGDNGRLWHPGQWSNKPLQVSLRLWSHLLASISPTYMDPYGHTTQDNRQMTQDTKRSKPCKSVSDYNCIFLLRSSPHICHTQIYIDIFLIEICPVIHISFSQPFPVRRRFETTPFELGIFRRSGIAREWEIRRSLFKWNCGRRLKRETRRKFIAD